MAGNSARTVQVNIVGDSSKLSSAMSKAGSDTESATGRITNAWKGVAGGLSTAFNGALDPVMSAINGASQAFEKLGEGGKKHVGLMAAGIGGGALAAGGVLQGFASKEQAAEQQLAQTYQNIGADIDDFKPKIDKTVGALAKYGYTGDQVKSSLNQLTAATKNPQQAIDLMSTAANLAAMRHEDLGSATNQLIQIIGGKGTRTLAELGIAHVKTASSASALTAATKAQHSAQDGLAAAQQKLSDLETIDHQKKTLTVADQIALRNAHDAVAKAEGKLTDANATLSAAQQDAAKSGSNVNDMLGEVANRTKGQASAAADTWTGKLKAARAEIENHVAEIGQKYGPALTAAGAGMTVLGGATETVSALMSKFRAGDEAVTAAEGIKTVSEAADTAAEGAEAAGATAADAASLPLILTVGLIVAAVAALGIGIYELATHWSTVWNGIKDVTVAVWHGIDNDFIHPLEDFFTGIPKFIEDHWQLILSILTGPFGAAVIWIVTHFQTVEDFFTGLPGKIGSAAEMIGKALANGIIFGINGIIDAWDWVMDHLKVPKIDLGPIHLGGQDLGGPLKIGHVPYLAEGGIVTGPMLAMLGDNRSGREAVVPLEKAGSMGFGGGAVTIEIPVVVDGREIARATVDDIQTVLLQRQKRNGTKVGLT